MERHLRVVVDGVIVNFDAVRVVDSKFGIVRNLDGLIDDTVPDLLPF